MILRLLAFTVSVLLVAGCTTQGRRTALTFERSFFYEELYDSMEQLKYYGYDESVQQSMSVLKTARWVSKYEQEPGKRELAVRAAQVAVGGQLERYAQREGVEAAVAGRLGCQDGVEVARAGRCCVIGHALRRVYAAG